MAGWLVTFPGTGAGAGSAPVAGSVPLVTQKVPAGLVLDVATHPASAGAPTVVVVVVGAAVAAIPGLVLLLAVIVVGLLAMWPATCSRFLGDAGSTIISFSLPLHIFSSGDDIFGQDVIPCLLHVDRIRAPDVVLLHQVPGPNLAQVADPLSEAVGPEVVLGLVHACLQLLLVVHLAKVGCVGFLVAASGLKVSWQRGENNSPHILHLIQDWHGFLEHEQLSVLMCKYSRPLDMVLAVGLLLWCGQAALVVPDKVATVVPELQDIELNGYFF